MFTIQTITKTRKIVTLVEDEKSRFEMQETNNFREAEKAFIEKGFAFVTFFISRNKISVEIEGFAAESCYRVKGARFSNERFVERFIDNCEGKETLRFVVKALEAGVVFLDTDTTTQEKLIRDNIPLYSKKGQIAARNTALYHCLTKEAKESIQPRILSAWIESHKQHLELLQTL